MISERNITRLCELILDEAQVLTGADGGTLYLVDDRHPPTELRFAIVHNQSLKMRLIAEPHGSVFPPIKLYADNGDIDQHHVAAFTAHAKTLINIDDAYDSSQFDFSGAKRFDQMHGYRTQSILAIPLLNEMNQLIGLLQLINAIDANTGEVIPFSEECEPMVAALAGFAATAIENRTVSESQRALLVDLAATSNTQEIIERILDEAKALTYAEGGTLYLLKDNGLGDTFLEFEIIKNNKLDIYLGGKGGAEIPFSGIPLIEGNSVLNTNNVAAYCANSKRVVNIPDVYQSTEFDFTGAREFDQKADYRTKSVLTLPLLNHRKEVIGVIQLVNARHPDTDHVIPFTERSIPLLKGLALYAAIALNNQILVRDLKNLLDAFIKTIAKAIDAKSPHTSGHCQRVPVIMEMIAQAACEDDSTYQDFNLTEEEWYELKVSAWMHDCGKLATPDWVLDKSTKLHRMLDGIEAIESRFAAMKAQLKIKHLEEIVENPDDKEALSHYFEQEILKIDDDLEFVRLSNKGGEFMSEDAKERVRQIALYTWEDVHGNEQPILDEEEVYNLCIERGTLTREERDLINNHMVVTLDMLEGLPFPKQLKRVPEYAGGHHEKMDGSGFPRGLTGAQMSIPARMMAIADVFEALTAKDRPYKDPMKVSMSLGILKRMVEDDHLDPDLFNLFIRKRVWEKYAKNALTPEQLDVEDASDYLVGDGS